MYVYGEYEALVSICLYVLLYFCTYISKYVYIYCMYVSKLFTFNELMHNIVHAPTCLACFSIPTMFSYEYIAQRLASTSLTFLFVTWTTN